MGIQRVAQRIGRHLSREIQMRDLAKGMNARIGSARGVERYALAAEIIGGFLDCSLYRWRAGLSLPARERRAVIFYGQFIAHGMEMPFARRTA